MAVTYRHENENVHAWHLAKVVSPHVGPASLFAGIAVAVVVNVLVDEAAVYHANHHGAEELGEAQDQECELCDMPAMSMDVDCYVTG